MIIFGCPVGMRHIPYIFNDQFRRIKHRLYPKPAAHIHFVYFSCAKDISLLKLSLKSLDCLKSDQTGMVYIVVDNKNPFSALQQSELKRIIPSLEFLSLGQIDWASIHTLQTELQAFGIAADQAMPRDFIAKVDSDILFFSKEKLEEISVCEADFVGDGHYSDYAYAQGGLYLLRKPLAKELSVSVSEAELEQTIMRYCSHAEDIIVSALAQQRTNNIWLTRLMLFPNEFEKTNLSVGWVRHEFSALHFVHRKSDLPIYAAKILR